MTNTQGRSGKARKAPSASVPETATEAEATANTALSAPPISSQANADGPPDVVTAEADRADRQPKVPASRPTRGRKRATGAGVEAKAPVPASFLADHVEVGPHRWVNRWALATLGQAAYRWGR